MLQLLTQTEPVQAAGHGTNVAAAAGRRRSSQVPLAGLLLSLPGARPGENHGLLLLLGQDGSVRGGEATGRQAGGNLPAARLRPRRLLVLRVVPQVWPVAARADRAVEPQIQFRLARPVGVHGIDGDGPGGALQGPNVGDVLRADADVAAPPELRVLAATAVPGVHRESHDVRRHQRSVPAGHDEELLEGISLQAEDPRPKFPRRRHQPVSVLVPGENIFTSILSPFLTFFISF